MKLTKTGRKQKHHVTAKGETVVGLTRRPDGRWRIIGTHQTFREPDEVKAVERFQRMTANEDAQSEASLERAAAPYMRKNHPIWRWFADQIGRRPQRIAEATGIEWTAYGPELKPQVPLPSFDELETTWSTYFKSNTSAVRRDVRRMSAIARLGWA